MNQDRRDAAAWAQEWNIRRKNRRLLYIIGGILLVALIGYIIHVIIVHAERSTFRSEEEMRAAMQGRYAIERDYEDIIIDGDEIVLTYLAFSHYNRDYAERYGYYYDEEDSIYEDRIREWDYRNGVIKTGWMGDMIVDKNGNIRREGSYYSLFYKTDKPRPDPIDPSTLQNPDGSQTELMPEDEEAMEELTEDLQSTEDAANEAEEEGLDTGKENNTNANQNPDSPDLTAEDSEEV